MDPLPLVKADFSNADVTYSLRRALQETLDGHTYQIDDAKTIIKNDVDEYLGTKKTAKEVLEISNDFDRSIKKINDAGKQIIEQQIQYLSGKEKIDKCFALKEHLKLKRCNLLKILEKDFVQEFGLIEPNDLLPDIINRYLDFRYSNIFHVCANCTKDDGKVRKNKDERKRSSCIPCKIMKTERVKKEEAFKVTPNFITFHNYIYGQTYKKTMRIVNTSRTTQSISIRKLPKNSIFFVHLDTNSKLAPGMSVTATVIFQPEVYRTLEDQVIFKNNNGYTVDIPLKASRDLPELISCLFKSTCNLLNISDPGTKTFSDARREALNSSIDCGSCLVGQYVLMSVLLENRGMPSKFFIITEEDWFSQDVESVSTCMEMYKNGFWIYPTFFEISTNETIELSIIFEPNRRGLHLETLYMICDNNSYEELEVMGDALEFSKSMIEISVNYNQPDISNTPDYCIHLGYIDNNTSQELIVTVENKSSLCLNCNWEFQYVPQPEVHELKEEWIKCEQPGKKYLVPYSTTSFKFDIFLDAQESGYHSTDFRFLILNIPMACLDENKEFLIIQRDTIEGKTLTEAADLQICEFEVVCVVDVLPKETPPVEECDCRTCAVPNHPISKLTFSEPFLNFGILPFGMNVQKNLQVQCLVQQKVDWRIAEIRYNIDSMPHSEVLSEDNLSCSSGTFQWRGQMQEISYNIIDRKPMSSVTVLVLLTTNEEKELEIQSICIITYEIIDYDIVINTGHSTGPILCPLNLLYVDVPVELEFKIENHSPIAGGFYFLKPYGKDSDKVSIKFHPQSSILKPMETRTVSAKIVCSEVGIFDNLTVPCSVGLGRKPVEMRVLCGVDSLHVCFYLQGGAENYKQVVWPPRIVYEFDNDWSCCQCTDEECWEFNENSFHHQENSKSEISSLTQESRNNMLLNNSRESVCCSKTISQESNEHKICEPKSLEDIFRETFEDEPFMLEEKVEIRNIPVDTPTKTTIYLKNITPVDATFTIEVQNFYGNKNLDPMVEKCIMKKNTVTIWNDLIGTEFGILVLPQVEKGSLAPYGLAEINIWIFANTYGIYSEEISIDIPDIPTFSFTLLMEVIGNPVVFPMTLNCLIDHPIIRIGCIPYNDPKISRQIKIRNSSCIPLHIVWQTFVKFSEEEGNEPKFSLAFDIVDENFHSDKGRMLMFDEYLGQNTNQLCGIEPQYMDMEKHSDGMVNIFLDPKCFLKKFQHTHVKCHIMGHIYLQEIHRSKINYFYRPTDPSINKVKIEVSATLELPILTLDSMCGETKLIVYANDVIFKKIFNHYARLVFRNESMSVCEAVMRVEDPFSVRVSKGEKASREAHVVVKGLECQEVTIACFVDYQKILELSELVYEDAPNELTNLTSKKTTKAEPRGREIYCTDKENKVLHIKKRLHIMQFGKLEEIIPIEMFIYFPNIKVKPANVKFGSVLLNTTRKTVISVYNLTGCAVKFEIYKSANATAFYVTPHFAEIPRSTGTNKQFVDIFIYFTPTECKAYQESIRIVTNIPNYFMEIPMKASGTVNEKFYVNYKI
ncbi:unnamed protein product [Phaedon cochleariae]|uniref:MSP domain-containing protein n=1 Tax=Phaedon cochleariae TaxID=80249 RepID=A0A9P0GML9_PHACE|nr:unnamed protein product [Phaedon cochleariae]